ncbi:hypothetical protein RB599_003818 [Gaeumannomyces hyphopodioides]
MNESTVPPPSRAADEKPILGRLYTSCEADSSPMGKEGVPSTMHPSPTPEKPPGSEAEEVDDSDCSFCNNDDERYFNWGPHTDCCTRCQGMTGTVDGLRRLLDPQGYEHSTRHELDESASAGCPVCRLMFVGYRAVYDVPRCRDKIVVKGSFVGPSRTRGSLEHVHPLEGIVLEGIQAYRRTKHEASVGRNSKSLFFEGLMMAPEASDPASRLMAAHLGCSLTDVTAAAIRRGLEECQEEHGSCPKRTSHPLPVRVIDVSSPSAIRLCQTKLGEMGQYATLSYCWGGAAQLTTDTANLQSHLQRIDPSSLSKTITDAIGVCRAVGMPYLWVDALCIVQDDEVDKRNQIRDMGRIYKQAMFSIVAASAKRAADGFLNSHEQIMTTSAVFTRGWTFQEWLLSPRAVVFDSSQVSLYCRTKNFRPAGCLAMPASQEYQYDRLQLPASIFGGVETCPHDPIDRYAVAECEHSIAEHQHRVWMNLVYHYSKRDFSLPDDRQPALEGIVAELAAVWDDKYLAGFWGRTIIQHLAWRIDLGNQHIERVYNERTLGSWEQKRPEGPSWSWVTSPDAVSLYDEMAIADARLVRCDIQLASPMSPFGEVRSASLTINAIVLDAPHLAAPNGAAMADPADHPRGHEWACEGFYMELDGYYVDHKPAARDCKFVYLGRRRTSDAEIYRQFLIVEPTRTGTYRRVGRSGHWIPEDTRPATTGQLAFTEWLEKAQYEDVIIE